MVGTRRLKQLVDSVTDRLALPDGDLVVALSGGADSATLAYLCTLEDHTVRAVHVDHGLPGSPLMEKAAIRIAEQLGLALDVIRVEVPAGPSPEGQARRARYSAFAENAGPDEVLLTGHTRDDDVETILLNMIRGTGARGLTGIPCWRPPNIYRPILGLDRSETREIASLGGLDFVDDPMNDDTGLTRNVLRLQVFPALSQLNPRIGQSLTRMATALAADIAELDRMTPFDSIRFEDGKAVAPIGQLSVLSKAVSDRLFVRMLSLVIGGAEVSADRVARVRSVLDPGAGRQQIGAGAVAFREGPMLVVTASSEAKTTEEPLSLTPGSHRYGGTEFEVAAIADQCRVFPLSRWAAVFPAGIELVVRPDGVVTADGELAWVPGEKRLPVAWYEPGTIGYLSVSARENTGWISSH